MRKPLLVGFLILALVLSTIAAGCIGGGTTQTSPTQSPTGTQSPTPTQTTETITKTETKTMIQNQVFIRFAGWSAGETEMKNYQRMIELFEKENPNIKVKYEVITQMFHENILASFGAGVAPDVFYVDSSWAPIFIEKGALYPISELADESFINKFYPFLLEPFKKNGKLYGLPKDWSMLALFYNKKLFEQAGLTKPPETWDELLEYAKIITEKTGKPGLAIYLGGFNRYVPVAVSNGAPKPWFEKPEDASWFDNPVVRETLTWYINLYRKGKVEREKKGLPPYVVAPEDVGAGWLGDAFGQQKVAMVISGNWMIPFLADQFPNFKYGEDWDIAPLPAGKNGRVTMVYTVILGINSKTKHPKEAWKFVEFILGPRGQKELVVKAGQTLPSMKGFENDPDLWPQHRKTLSFKYDKMIVFLWGPKSGPLEAKFSDAMAAAMRGDMSIDEAIETMKQVVQEELSQ
ncbi:ABC transporter substrate-binding protein [Pyrococcus horikoshii]|nr:ABC transporter substrate-binding protein [Pyrococcus horikoshii]HII61401.1 ABC transporter substrate-binding protein [Pyrococcus horikoshii]